jgi:hypothetical protein
MAARLLNIRSEWDERWYGDIRVVTVNIPKVEQFVYQDFVHSSSLKTHDRVRTAGSETAVDVLHRQLFEAGIHFFISFNTSPFSRLDVLEGPKEAHTVMVTKTLTFRFCPLDYPIVACLCAA